ncbi:selenium-dependent molybdenum cofactor biosynthesis protein YqeB [Dethiobacter alkaliphilus]|uniref:selenium-dependent molybdenum cofactor biosynthesis protein YqeB n=1 Tax=Dethiobacter alkaliphilus TaxID=427926 RepID=UPI002227EEB2|nr:selenium-dependent molybdenum cofactor biosynthesis protein YqeB [Dethiobacter alkaliphilus]MCW3490015.1 selenium-dependent molybdenum cofactor biosynthesis protein YqeB [Dethiobacter alkaliphilus]
MNQLQVIIKGAGDLATGVAHRLHQCGFAIIMLEIPKPTVIRRTVAFAETIYEGEYTVEGVRALLARDAEHAAEICKGGQIAVLTDPQWTAVGQCRPQVVVDAIVAKKNMGTFIDEAPVTIGLGPGFTAGVDVSAVVETQRGHNLGRVIYQGQAAPNTGKPGKIGGYSTERLLRSPGEGVFQGLKSIGDFVKEGEVVARIEGKEVRAGINGVLRGVLRTGVYVRAGCKIGDIDPRANREHCFTISDKARSVAGGVLEAILHLSQRCSHGS